jgi:hypothetical protein
VEADMKRVKGTVLVDFVKSIKANKSGVYDKFLAAEDKSIISQRILPSAWYPYETFRRCFNAVFEVDAKRNLETVKNWGVLYGQKIMTDLYKGLLKQGEPLDSLKKYQVYIRNFFDFGKIEVIEEKPHQVLVKVIDFDSDFAPLYYMFYGWMERTMVLCGAKNLLSEIVSRSWQDPIDTVFRFRWDI